MARIGGSRGRLVGDAVVLLFFTLKSRWDAKPGESAHRGEPNARKRRVNWQALVVVGGGRNRTRVYPSANIRGVTGLKGSPLRNKLVVLAEERRWRWRRVEDKTTSAARGGVATASVPPATGGAASNPNPEKRGWDWGGGCWWWWWWRRIWSSMDWRESLRSCCLWPPVLDRKSGGGKF